MAHAQGTVEIDGKSHGWRVSPKDEKAKITADEIALAAKMAATIILNEKRK